MISKNYNLSSSDFSSYLNAARKSLIDENWISALDIALTLPGICSNIDPDTKNLNSDSIKYKTWYQKNVDDATCQIVRTDGFLPRLKPSYDAETVYKLRCSMLHQGEALTEYLDDRFNSNDNGENSDINTIKINIYTQDTGQTPSFNNTETLGGFVRLGSDITSGPYNIEVNIFVKELCQKLIKASKDYYDNNQQRFANFKGLFNWIY